MNIVIVEYVAALIGSVALDGVWLGVISKSWYKKYIGDLMLEKPHLIPALLFYLIYGAATVVFIIDPAIRNSWSTSAIIFRAALLGLIIYGAYDLTNLAVLKGWSIPITLIDIAWGMTFTTLVSLIAIYLTKLIIK